MATAISSCNDKYGDDLRSLGKRVEVLEDSLPEMNRMIQTLQTILYTIDTDGFITDVIQNPNGTYTIRFNNGKVVTLRDGQDGQDGHDGSADNFDISVAKGEDGVWYWTLNGQWIIDDDGNRMRAGAIDGKDGKNGANGKDGKDDINLSLPIPLTRVNPITRFWEISTDGGVTYKSTGVLADGKDGEDGSAENFDISVGVGPDGKLYWKVNGQWLLDESGNLMPATGKDGADGQDGKNGKDDVNLTLPVPMVRINPVTRFWEISTDGGTTYKSTGILADGNKGEDGKDGEDGTNGKNGKDDTFFSVTFTPDGTKAVITLRDGRQFVIPINSHS